MLRINVGSVPKDRRKKRDVHALDGDGMVVCNSRDVEAAHRAAMGDNATAAANSVTCRKCLDRLLKNMRSSQAKK